MNKIILIVLLLGISSCNNYKILIDLVKESKGYNNFFYSNVNEYNNQDSILSKFMETDSFGVFSVSLHPRQSYYNLLRLNKIDTIHFLYLSQNDDSPVDTSGKLKYKTLFFFGKKKNDEFLFISDQNNNGDFNDDKQFVIKKNKGTNVYRDSLKFKLYNIEGFDGTKIKKYTIPIVVEFYLSSSFNTSYFVLIGGEKWTGDFFYSGTRYSLKIGRENFPGAPYRNNFTYSLQLRDPATDKKRYLFANKRIDEKFYMNEKNWRVKKLRLGKSKVVLEQSDESVISEKNVAQNLFLIGKELPSLNFSYIKVSDSSLKGKVVLINFWFANCEPCIREVPFLNKLYMANKENPGFVFLSFTFESTEAISKFRERYRLSFPIHSIPQDECFRLSRSMFYPTTILLDRNGKICHYINGEITDENGINAYNDLSMLIKKNLEL